MVDKKVSDKVVWEEGVTSDNDFTPTASQSQFAFQPMSQPQMMFCYKCNNVLPSGSKYCPFCQTELYVSCPKCEVKYSSQYPNCSQCGTNRQKFIQMEKKEQERKAAIEQQKRLDRVRDEEKKRQEKEAYISKNKEIMKTPEYLSTYAIVKELFDKAFEIHRKKCKIMQNLFFLFIALPFIPVIIMFFVKDGDLPVGLIITSAILFIPLISLVIPYNIVYYDGTRYLKNVFLQYIANKNDYDQGMLTQDLVNMAKYQGLHKLSECCIIAYRKKHNLPINYKWHSLR
jgi:hypothetical protein